MKKPEIKYQTLAEWIKTEIQNGRVKKGEKFYSENKLSEKFGYSRQTVRQAISLLVSENYLERRHGSGTFVVFDNNMRRSKTKNIGVISTYIDDYIFPKIIKGIDEVLSKSGYLMQLSITNNTIEKEETALLSMIENDVDGIIVEPTKSGFPNPNAKLYKQLKERGVPIVFFNAHYQSVKIPCVSLDDRLTGEIATEHLISKGFKRIAGIFKSDDIQGHYRYEGYLKALRNNKLEINSERVIWYTTEDEDDFLSASSNKNLRIGECDAVVCYNDKIATKLLSRLELDKLNVPDDIAIISVDNAPIAELCSPKLTTVNHPKEELGRKVASNLLALIADPTFDANHQFTPTIVERDSI